MTRVMQLLPFSLALALASGGALAETAAAETAEAVNTTAATEALNTAATDAAALTSEVMADLRSTIDSAKNSASDAAERVEQAVEEISTSLGLDQLPGDVPTVEERALAIGVGAIAGVVAFNVLTGGLTTVPVLAVLGTEGTALATSNVVATSRVYAATSAVAGAWAGDYLYRSGMTGRLPGVSPEVAARVTP